MHKKFIIFLVVVFTIITILVIHDMNRDPVQMSPVFFSQFHFDTVTWLSTYRA